VGEVVALDCGVTAWPTPDGVAVEIPAGTVVLSRDSLVDIMQALLALVTPGGPRALRIVLDEQGARSA
jgi:hypothetical protein